MRSVERRRLILNGAPPNRPDQPVDIGTDRLARDRKDPLVLPKLSHPQLALNPGLKVSIQNRDRPTTILNTNTRPDYEFSTLCDRPAYPGVPVPEQHL